MKKSYLTYGMKRVLNLISCGEIELDRFIPGGWWIEENIVPSIICNRLLRLCLIKRVYEGKDVESFVITEEGKKILEDEYYIPEIVRKLPEYF